MPLKTLWPINPTTTQELHGLPCSSTAYGWLSLFPTSSGNVWKAGYSGGTSCAGGVGLKKLVLSLQILGPDHVRWWTITGSTVVAGPSGRNTVRAEAPYRQLVTGHAYRVQAIARLSVPFPIGHWNEVLVTSTSKRSACPRRTARSRCQSSAKRKRGDATTGDARAQQGVNRTSAARQAGTHQVGSAQAPPADVSPRWSRARLGRGRRRGRLRQAAILWADNSTCSRGPLGAYAGHRASVATLLGDR
jgi:hypothetical protein